MFNFLNNYNKFLFSLTGINDDDTFDDDSSVTSTYDLRNQIDDFNEYEEDLDKSSVTKHTSKRSALKTAGENLVQNTKENITAIALTSAGTALTGFGVYKIVDKISKTSASVFSDEANKFHEFYNANKEILGIPGVDSFLSGTNKDLILNFLNLKDQSLINTLLGNQSLFTNNNALSLFQNDSFLNLINPENSNSLNLLFNNISLFTNENINVIKNIMGNESLQTLLNNDGFKNLLNDEKFLSLLQDPEGLKKFFQGAQQLIDDKYLNVLNDPVLSGIFKDSEIQNLLTNPEMLAMLKNPEFFALFSDPNIAPFLTNPDFQALLMGNPDLIKNLLSNPDILKFLNTPEAIQMLQNPQLATLLQNQVSSDAFFEMFKNPEMLQNVLKSNDLTNYLEASANVGVSTGAMAGIIISILVGIILTGVGLGMFTSYNKGSHEFYKESYKIDTIEPRNQQEPQKKTFLNNLSEKLSNLFSKVFSFFKKDKMTSKDLEEVNSELTETLISVQKDANEIQFKSSFVLKSKTGAKIDFKNTNTFVSETLDYEDIVNKILEFITTSQPGITINNNNIENIIQNAIQNLSDSDKNMNPEQTKKFFQDLIDSSIEQINTNQNEGQKFDKITLENIEVVKAPEKTQTRGEYD